LLENIEISSYIDSIELDRCIRHRTTHCNAEGTWDHPPEHRDCA
jgi:hypothetical protein